MKKVNLYISRTAPHVGLGSVWLKPVSGGYALYILGDGWKPVKLIDDKGTSSEADDTIAETASEIKTELIGSVQDEGTENTINGAKAYANSKASDIIGTSSDTGEDLTLYGLKAYIDSLQPEEQTTVEQTTEG